MDAKLVIVGGHASKGEVKLKLPMTIGRNPGLGLTISHNMVSRMHCEIYEFQGALVVRDNDSGNGTMVNGERVKEAILKPGDKLAIGPLTFVVIYQHSGQYPVLESPVLGTRPAQQAAPAAKPQAKPQPSARQQPSAKPQPQGKAQPPAKPQPQGKGQPQAKPQPQTQQKAKPQPQAKPEPKSSPKPGPTAASKPAPKPERKPEPKPADPIDSMFDEAGDEDGLFNQSGEAPGSTFAAFAEGGNDASDPWGDSPEGDGANELDLADLVADGDESVLQKAPVGRNAPSSEETMSLDNLAPGMSVDDLLAQMPEIGVLEGGSGIRGVLDSAPSDSDSGSVFEAGPSRGSFGNDADEAIDAGGEDDDMIGLGTGPPRAPQADMKQFFSALTEGLLDDEDEEEPPLDLGGGVRTAFDGLDEEGASGLGPDPVPQDEQESDDSGGNSPSLTFDDDLAGDDLRDESRR